MAGETMTQEEVRQRLKDEGIDIRPALERVKRMIAQSKRIADLEAEVGRLREAIGLLRPYAMYYAEANGSKSIEWQDYLKALSLLHAGAGEQGAGTTNLDK